MIPAITPVFVVGMPRSGTKWLSNILCNHSQIAGVQSQQHCGIIETNMFGVMPAKFDLSNPDDYLAFVELWAESDFFRHLGLAKECLLARPRAVDHFALFAKVMHEFAVQQGKSFWVQKISPERAQMVLPRLQGSRCIAIERDLIDNITSTLQLKSNQGIKPSVLEASYSTVAQHKALRQVIKRHEVLPVRYEQLRQSPTAVVQAICDHVGIGFEAEMLNVRFRKNTSFQGQRHATAEYVSRHRTIIRLLTWAIGCLPLAAMRGYSKTKAVLRGAKPPAFIRGTFSELADELCETESDSAEVARESPLPSGTR